MPLAQTVALKLPNLGVSVFSPAGVPAMNICRGCIAVATALLCASECVSFAMTKVVRRQSLRSAAALKLHLYDHCPYCTRVELVLGWHGKSYERAVYGYADVQGPMALTGKKVLPVITWLDEENMEHTMGESLDIIEAGIEKPEPGLRNDL